MLFNFFLLFSHYKENRIRLKMSKTLIKLVYFSSSLSFPFSFGSIHLQNFSLSFANFLTYLNVLPLFFEIFHEPILIVLS